MTRTGQPKNRHRWFNLWIVLGAITAIVLLANSVSNYLFVSQRVLVEAVRRDLAGQVALLDHELRAADGTTTDLTQLLNQAQSASNGKISWIQVFDRTGTAIAFTGSQPHPSFERDYVESHLRQRQPVFKTVQTSSGEVLAELFSIRLPQRPGQTGPELKMAEMATSLDIPAEVLWPIRRILLINVMAGLVLLFSLAAVAVRFRAYIAGKQLEQQLKMARQVQKDLLPPASQAGELFRMAAECLPAEHVGGDFYDTFPVECGRANGARGNAGRANLETSAFVLGDVSGKGIPAALLMGVMHGAVRSSRWSESAEQHEEATRQINGLLYEHASGERYASMFWSYFDPQKELLHYINAGHCAPLLFRDGAESPIRLTEGGPVLGLLPKARFEQGTVKLRPDDVLVLYSDGIVETTNDHDEEFGEERLVAEVARNLDRTPREIRDGVLDAVRAFSNQGAQEDDRTLLVIRYQGRATENVPAPESESAEILAV